MAKVLIVAGSADEQEQYQQWLLRGEDCHEVFTAATAQDGLAQAQSLSPDVLLVDQALLNQAGFLKPAGENAQQPVGDQPLPWAVIILAQVGQVTLAVQAMKAGAQDYLIKKDLTPALLGKAVTDAIAQVRQLRQQHQRLAQEHIALRRSEAFRDQILESSPDCIKVLDLEGRLLYMNVNGMGLMEIDDFSSFEQSDWLSFWPEGMQPQAEAALSQAKRGETALFSGPCPTAKGTRKWWEVLVRPIQDEEGRVERLVSISRDISDRKQAELALRQSEQRSRQIIDSLFSFVGIVSLDGILLEANRTALDAAGLEVADVVGQPFDQAYWWSFSSFEQQRLREAIDTATAGKMVRYDAVVRVKDGLLITIDFTLVPVKNDDGQVEYLIPSGIDITERKQAEQALKESEHLLKMALSSAQAGSWSWEISTGNMVGSPENYHLCGLDPATAPLQYSDWQKHIHPDDREVMNEAVRQVLAGKQPRFRAEFRVHHPQLGQRWLIGLGNITLDDQGEPLRLSGINLDITERKRTEAALATSTWRYETLFNAIDEGFSTIEMIFDQDGHPVNYRFLEVNTAFAQQTGLSSDAVGKTVLELIPNLEPYWIERYGQVALTGKSGRFEEGSEALGRWFEVYACRLGDPSSHQVAIVFKDVSERKKTEIEREQLLSQAQAAQAAAETANRTKDEFLAIVSHELRTPLNPILGWAQLLGKSRLGPEKTQRALGIIERNARIQAQLIDDLLDVSRILRGKVSLALQPIRLGSVIQSALETVRLSADAKAIAISSQIEPNMGYISGDMGRLQQVYCNLLTNAIKFTPEGGRIEIEVKAVNDQAQVSIRDTGKGIPAEFLPHVFDRFRQQDGTITREFGGLGLGLAIVHHLVRLHGGEVWVESPGEGQGSTFTVALPLLPQSLGAGRAPATKPSCDLTGVRILLVDDDADAREVATYLLEDSGAAVVAESTARKAFLSLGQSSFDLLISDIGMPQVDGYQFMAWVRQLSPERGGKIPAIALTAYASEIDHQRALAAGFQRHIAKPINVKVLVEAIAQLVGAKSE